MSPYIEAPDGWHWGIGESSDGYYDHWLYTNAGVYQAEDSRGRKLGYEIHLYWDKPGDHHVALIPIEHYQPGGDHSYGYEESIGSFDTAEAAAKAAVEKAAELR